MSVAFENIGAWVLSPYCFCQNRDWLSVENLHFIDKGTSGGDGTTSGLSADDTALLAAFILAIALFLFLLYLLICCLCPGGLCCGDRGLCCSKASKLKNGGKMKSGHSNAKVNLTEVDIKIPRPWTTDSSIGYSNGKMLKSSGGQKQSNFEKQNWIRGDGHLNEAYSEDEGWFSTSELDSLYGEKDRKENFVRSWSRNKRAEDLNSMGKYQANRNSSRNSSLTFRNRSYSTADVERLMTPKSTQEVSFSDSLDSGTLRGGRHIEQFSYAVTAVNRPDKETQANSDSALKSSTMNAVAEISFNGKSQMADLESSDMNVHSLKPLSYVESYKSNSSIVPLIDIPHNTNGRIIYPDVNMITETSSTYKRQVIEETETVII